MLNYRRVSLKNFKFRHGKDTLAEIVEANLAGHHFKSSVALISRVTKFSFLSQTHLVMGQNPDALWGVRGSSSIQNMIF